jgi:hypothetical protein
VIFLLVGSESCRRITCSVMVSCAGPHFVHDQASPDSVLFSDFLLRWRLSSLAHKRCAPDLIFVVAKFRFFISAPGRCLCCSFLCLQLAWSLALGRSEGLCSVRFVFPGQALSFGPVFCFSRQKSRFVFRFLCWFSTSGWMPISCRRDFDSAQDFSSSVITASICSKLTHVSVSSFFCCPCLRVEVELGSIFLPAIPFH